MAPHIAEEAAAEKFNPHHDARGRFASGGGGSTATSIPERSDVMKVRKFLRMWVTGEQREWTGLAEKHAATLAKFKPDHPVHLYRAETNRTGEYNRPTSWTFDRNLQYGGSGRKRIEREIAPSDILFSMPHYNRAASRFGLSSLDIYGQQEVVVKPLRVTGKKTMGILDDESPWENMAEKERLQEWSRSKQNPG